MKRPISIPNMPPLPPEKVEMDGLIGKHYEMMLVLMQARHVVEGAEMDEDEKAELMVGLNDVYRYLRWPLESRAQDIDGRRN